jgi:hypothetical protein
MEEDGHECESLSCTTDLLLNRSDPVLINANYSALVGINLITKAKCICKYDELRTKQIESCSNTKCANGGTCVQFDYNKNTVKCQCPKGMDGPYCEQTIRSFSGQGWIWLEPIPQCYESHISLQIMTQIPNGLILYYGPITQNLNSIPVVNDFMSLELRNGKF